jgi:FkbM family methyltransferase
MTARPGNKLFHKCKLLYYKWKWIFDVVKKPYRIRDLNRGYGIVKILSKNFYVPVNTNTPVPYADRVISEKWMEGLLRSLLDSKSVFIDVGAHIGQTMLKVKASQPLCRYIGIEPQKECVEFLEKLIKSNNLENYYSVWAAAAPGGQTISNLYIPRPGATSSTTAPEFKPNKYLHSESRTVPAISIDELKKTEKFDLKEINMIKIDVERNELSVLQGCDDVMETDRPYILLEILPSENDTMFNSQVELKKLMDSKKYKMYRVIKNINLDHVEALEIVEKWPLIYQPGSRTRYDRDYLFIPEENVSRLNIQGT